MLQYQERCCLATVAQSGSVAQYVRPCPVVWEVRVAELMSVVAMPVALSAFPLLGTRLPQAAASTCLGMRDGVSGIGQCLLME